VKELIITLLILVSNNKIEQKNILIYESCYKWYEDNIKMTVIKTDTFSQRPYHTYKGQRVVGYMCSDKRPT
jgi:hypothetical protein